MAQGRGNLKITANDWELRRRCRCPEWAHHLDRDGIARITASTTRWPARCASSRPGVRIALNLEEESVGAVLLGEFKRSRKAICQAERAHHLVPVGEQLLGASSMTWAAIDGKGPLGRPSSRRSSGWRRASSIGSRERAAADRPEGDRRDGAIGRGQRELIIGDRQTGKTASQRRHPQSEGTRRPLHLQRDRPET